MMQLIHRISANGTFIEDVLLTNGDSVPSDCITTHPPDGLQCPQWTGSAWVDAGYPWPPTAEQDPSFPQPEESAS